VYLYVVYLNHRAKDRSVYIEEERNKGPSFFQVDEAEAFLREGVGGRPEKNYFGFICVEKIKIKAKIVEKRVID